MMIADKIVSLDTNNHLSIVRTLDAPPKWIKKKKEPISIKFEKWVMPKQPEQYIRSRKHDCL